MAKFKEGDPVEIVGGGHLVHIGKKGTYAGYIPAFRTENKRHAEVKVKLPDGALLNFYPWEIKVLSASE